MAVTNYYTIDGQMIGYKGGAGRRDYLTDSLGSVTAEVDQTGATKTYDGRYKPYGSDLSSTGSRGSYSWVGSRGYRNSNLSAANYYIRSRTYNSVTATWTTQELLWPALNAYQYCLGMPTILIDFNGTIPISLDSGGYFPGTGGSSGGYADDNIPPISGGIKFDNCLHIDIPVPIRAGFLKGASFGFDICLDIYDTKCCKPPATASQCVTIKIRLGVTIAVPTGFDFKDLPEEVRMLHMAISNMLASSFNPGLGQIPQKGCPEKGTVFDEFKVCIKACVGIVSTEFCAGTKGISIDTKIGWCGFPSVKVTAQAGIKNCT